MIPRTIHYCWFGKGEKSKLILDCIESWRKYCPDFEIIEWNEDNFDIGNSCQYVREAYDAKKWAFVSDYVRHAILDKFGGIYLDTDVEIIKPLEGLLEHPFLALENANSINTGLIMGCESGNEYCKWMLNSYENDCFILVNGELNVYTVCERTTKYFKEHGFINRNIAQEIDGFMIYPTEYFCPKDPITFEMQLTENTVSIHHYGASWCTEEQKYYFQLRMKYVKKYPYKIASVISYYKAKKAYHGTMKAIVATAKKIIRKNRGR
ncbi:MAG: glycosyl transferase [Clostridia bacterium]|nr:glycosyl transferase [Clostridia bacterium]